MERWLLLLLVHVVRVVARVAGAVAPTVHMMMVLISRISAVAIVVVKLLLMKMMGWQLMVRLLLHQLTLVAEGATGSASTLVSRLILIDLVDPVRVAPVVLALLGVG